MEGATLAFAQAEVQSVTLAGMAYRKQGVKSEVRHRDELMCFSLIPPV